MLKIRRANRCACTIPKGMHMNTKRRWFQTMILAAALGSASVASAAVITTYTDRAVWTAAVGAPSFTVDFESYTATTSFASAPLNVGPFTLSTVGTAPAGTEFIDVVPFISTSPIPPSFGNATAAIYVNGKTPVAADLTFATGVSGFFADFLYAGNRVPLTLTLSFAGGGTADVSVPGIGTGLEPFGFVSTTGITAIRLNNSVNDGFFIDNVSGVTPLARVPEPASLALVGIALAALGFSRRRSKLN